MQAKELMIGDLVYEGTNHQIKIKHNYGKSVRYDEDGYSHEVEETLIHPISLTPEIIEANGMDEEILSYVFYDGYNFSLTDGKRSIVDVGPIWYVHQLQHALRLCGLNDLADNFKVE